MQSPLCTWLFSIDKAPHTICNSNEYITIFKHFTLQIEMSAMLTMVAVLKCVTMMLDPSIVTALLGLSLQILSISWIQPTIYCNVLV